MYLRWIKYFCKVIPANGEGNVQLFTKSTNFFIFERKLALLVALQVFSSKGEGGELFDKNL